MIKPNTTSPNKYKDKKEKERALQLDEWTSLALVLADKQTCEASYKLDTHVSRVTTNSFTKPHSEHLKAAKVD